MTHTYAILEVSESAWSEVSSKLKDAGHAHALLDGLIDMHGIALKAEPLPTISDESISETPLDPRP